MPGEGTENLIRFVQAAAAAPDSPALIRAIATREGWPALCAHLVATGRAARPPSPGFAIACHQAGTTPERLLKRLAPVALALRLVPEDDPHRLYALLGLPPDAAPAAIRSAYRRRARQLHPDGNPRGADRLAFTALTQAYRRLNRSDPHRDRNIACATPAGWYERPPRPRNASRRTRFPLTVAVLLPLLVLLAFGLDFVYRELDGPHHAVGLPATLSPRTPMVGEPHPTPPAPAARPAVATAPLHQATETPAAPIPTRLAAAPPAPDLPAAPRPAASPRAADHPRLMLFYNENGGSAAADVLSAFLQGRGYQTAAPAAVTYTGPNSVRFFHPDDRPTAADIRRAVGRFMAQRAGADRTPLRLADLSRQYSRPRPGLIEIWLNRASAGTPDHTTREAEADAAAEDIEVRLQSFITAYCRAYQTGDLARLAAFFHPAATENGQPFETLLTHYRRNLSQYAALDYQIEVSRWERHSAPEGLKLSGRFFARARLEDRQLRESRGRIAMDLEPRGESFAIRRLDYAIEAEP